MLHIIRVTQEDIDKADRIDNDPVTLAIHRALPEVKYVTSSRLGVHIGYQLIYLNTTIDKWLDDYYKGYPVQPIDFIINYNDTRTSN